MASGGLPIARENTITCFATAASTATPTAIATGTATATANTNTPPPAPYSLLLVTLTTNVGRRCAQKAGPSRQSAGIHEEGAQLDNSYHYRVSKMQRAPLVLSLIHI